MKKLLIFLSILILIGIFALSPVNATNNITLSLNKNNITYGENSDVTITLKENGTPLHNKEVKLDIYSSSVNFLGGKQKKLMKKVKLRLILVVFPLVIIMPGCSIMIIISIIKVI
ncbi:hypothetical protein [Methanobrevibacter arboriphilus]|uniref:hypothetical protein n=1 Tax=Methanobrevibacter arboriphilus TaxID=39441 RepID=UPI0006D007B7|nr:hypothetical protein [Methanobrevibacter arboriphilus]